ncbi:uncharacterized protein LY89DRAFT_742666 [Mollisia scopiformis]|uniref:Uncharacterized protein n=1 Tax=Mollisia scopiformis TaxID=149040 RepID=A0A132B669_MOLSC|nr:uncharacterized protein LY89DRAFT_742666 [Mollisia scopiformis]KUJ07905.1 hypothetical protein LY89DRAFT_742666 [Mollisia scopiformis]
MSLARIATSWANSQVTLIRNSGVSNAQRGVHVPPQNKYGQSTSWTPLFNPDARPAPVFVTKMQQIFACLDPGWIGYLSPEAGSGVSCSADHLYGSSESSEHGPRIIENLTQKGV